jgi:hypothetical protein
MPKGENPHLRFSRFVNKNGPIPAHRPELGKCWLWTGGSSSNQNGYRCGYFTTHGKQRHATRAQWFLTFGQWPSDGVFVCHHCDNSMCVNPSHLFLGTPKDNVHDCIRKWRAKTGRIPCGLSISRKKLSREIIGKAHQLKKDGWTYLRIAENFGVGETTIYKALKGLTWKSGDGHKESHSYGPEVLV